MPLRGLGRRPRPRRAPRAAFSQNRRLEKQGLRLAGFHEEGRLVAAALVRKSELSRGLAPGAARRPRRPGPGRRGAGAASHSRAGGNRRRRGARWIGRLRRPATRALTPPPYHCCVYKLLPDIIQAEERATRTVCTRCSEQCQSPLERRLRFEVLEVRADAHEAL